MEELFGKIEARLEEEREEVSDELISLINSSSR